MHRQIARLCAAASFSLAVLLLSFPVHAQNANQPQQGMPNFNGRPGQEQERTTLTGKLTAAQAPLIKLKPEKGNQEWTIRVDSKPNEIIVRGEAEKAWVRPGMFVHFEATLDKKGVGQSAISKVSVFTPTPQLELGVTEQAELPDFSSTGEQETTESTAEEVSKYTVVGRLSGVSRDGKWSVSAGKAKVTVEIAEDAKISVELPDPRLIRMGDTVKGTVHYYDQGVGILKGEVEVEAAQPFAAPEDPREARRNRRNRDKDDAPANPAEAKSIFDM
ncbi:hypothetical protein [Bremerella alba]|uniref:DUF5666 domain-containing protein n=1 Tax=Bremerella alba TaxID=980252 RepID=A0A7V8V406_9BACT|nr:hypothetical protein [Bremerella alba]MBA2114522.1 hypothetical protein [Bremerella alba]